MPDMRTALIVAASAVLLASCANVTPTAIPATSQTATTVAPTTTTSSSATPAYDKWNPKFDAARGEGGSACSSLVLQSQGCAAYLTRIVSVATDLQGELKGKPAYVKTLGLVRQVVEAGAAYGNQRCREGAGSFETCQAHVVGVVIGSLSVTTALLADDLSAP